MFKDTDQISHAVASGNVQKIADLLDGSDFDAGLLEDLQGTIDNLSLFCGSLVKLLIEKKILTVEEAETLFSIRS